jgi:hypothetical protein
MALVQDFPSMRWAFQHKSRPSYWKLVKIEPIRFETDAADMHNRFLDEMPPKLYKNPNEALKAFREYAQDQLTGRLKKFDYMYEGDITTEPEETSEGLPPGFLDIEVFCRSKREDSDPEEERPEPELVAIIKYQKRN